MSWPLGGKINEFFVRAWSQIGLPSIVGQAVVGMANPDEDIWLGFLRLSQDPSDCHSA